jgi:hypothetical protein
MYAGVIVDVMVAANAVVLTPVSVDSGRATVTRAKQLSTPAHTPQLSMGMRPTQHTPDGGNGFLQQVPCSHGQEMPEDPAATVEAQLLKRQCRGVGE